MITLDFLLDEHELLRCNCGEIAKASRGELEETWLLLPVTFQINGHEILPGAKQKHVFETSGAGVSTVQVKQQFLPLEVPVLNLAWTCREEIGKLRSGAEYKHLIPGGGHLLFMRNVDHLHVISSLVSGDFVATQAEFLNAFDQFAQKIMVLAERIPLLLNNPAWLVWQHRPNQP